MRRAVLLSILSSPANTISLQLHLHKLQSQLKYYVAKPSLLVWNANPDHSMCVYFTRRRDKKKSGTEAGIEQLMRALDNQSIVFSHMQQAACVCLCLCCCTIFLDY